MYVYISNMCVCISMYVYALYVSVYCMYVCIVCICMYLKDWEIEIHTHTYNTCNTDICLWGYGYESAAATSGPLASAVWDGASAPSQSESTDAEKEPVNFANTPDTSLNQRRLRRITLCLLVSPPLIPPPPLATPPRHRVRCPLPA